MEMIWDAVGTWIMETVWMGASICLSMCMCVFIVFVKEPHRKSAKGVV